MGWSSLYGVTTVLGVIGCARDLAVQLKLTHYRSVGSGSISTERAFGSEPGGAR